MIQWFFSLIEALCWVLIDLVRQKTYTSPALPAGVRLVKKEEVPALLIKCANTYYQTPLMRWNCADDKKNIRELWESCHTVFRMALRLFSSPYDGAMITEDGKATCWVTPAGVRITMLQMSLSFPIFLMSTRSWKALKRAVIASNSIDTFYGKWKNEDTIHIGNLLRLKKDGDGAVRQLLRPLKEQGRRIILECEDPKNWALYKKEGFKTVGTIDVGNEEIFYVFMVWEPE